MNEDNTFYINHAEVFCEISRRMKNFLELSMSKIMEEAFELDKAMEEVERVSSLDSLSYEKMNDLKENLEELSSYEPDSINDIKKRIKYCKSPLELKQLNQKLNALYKEQKRKR